MQGRIIDDIAAVLVDLNVAGTNTDIIRELANILIDLELLDGGF